MEQTEDAARPRCATCDAKLRGKFCHKCGEKVVDREDFTLRHFLSEVFSKFTHLDSKVLRSLWLLCRRPGFLSAAYLQGRRKPYMKPLTLFFLVNLLYFLTISINHLRTFENPLQSQLRNPYSPVVERMVAERLAGATEAEKAAFELAFDQQNHQLAKSMLLLLVPVLAICLWLLYFREGVFFGEHLITALHFQALLVLQNMVLGIFFRGSLSGFFPLSPLLHQLFVELIEPILWVWLFAWFTLKTVYPASAPATLWRSFIFAACWLPALLLYRFVIFLVTFYSI